MSDKKYDPLTGELVPQGNGQLPHPQQSPAARVDIEAIDAMPEAELRALCKRMACQCGLIARMTQEETAQAMLDVLAETALKPISVGLSMKADIQNRLNAIDKWLDRTRGKPAQASDITINANVQTTAILGLNEAQQIELLEDMADRLRRKRAPTIEAIPYVVQEAAKDDDE